MSALLDEEMEQEERFTVTDDQKADWCLRKIAEADAELQKLTDWYERQTALAKERHDSRVAFFSGLLEEYFATVPAKDTKTTKKYALPSGELLYTKEKSDYVKADEEKLLSWCVSNDPEMIKTVASPKWAEIKKRLTMVEGKVVDKETGLFVDGVTYEAKPGKFEAKVRGI